MILVDGPLRSVTQWLTRVLEKITSLAQAHPVLTRQLLIAGGALLAMTATIRSLSLVIGVLYGKLATLRLGFDILTRSMNVVRVLPALWGMLTGSVSLLGGAIGRCSVRLVLSWLRLPELPFLSGNTGIPSGHFLPGVQRDYGKADPVARNL